MVLTASDIPAMPATVTPMPACATAEPHTDNGWAPNRARTVANGARNSRVRSTSSASAPAISQADAAKPSAARPACRPSAAAMPMSVAISAAHHNFSSAGHSSARFHGSTGPSDMATNSGMASGNTVAWKYGGPTLSLAPNTSSANSG